MYKVLKDVKNTDREDPFVWYSSNIYERKWKEVDKVLEEKSTILALVTSCML